MLQEQLQYYRISAWEGTDSDRGPRGDRHASAKYILVWDKIPEQTKSPSKWGGM